VSYPQIFAGWNDEPFLGAKRRSMKRSSRFLDFSAFSAGLAYYGYLPGDWRFHRPRRAEFPAQGVDVSHHQGKIDWNELQSDGLNFTYIKATEGGSYRAPLSAVMSGAASQTPKAAQTG
jgi:hypothetical protein